MHRSSPTGPTSSGGRKRIDFNVSGRARKINSTDDDARLGGFRRKSLAQLDRVADNEPISMSDIARRRSRANKQTARANISRCVRWSRCNSNEVAITNAFELELGFESVYKANATLSISIAKRRPLLQKALNPLASEANVSQRECCLQSDAIRSDPIAPISPSPFELRSSKFERLGRFERRVCVFARTQ